MNSEVMWSKTVWVPTPKIAEKIQHRRRDMQPKFVGVSSTNRMDLPSKNTEEQSTTPMQRTREANEFQHHDIQCLKSILEMSTNLVNTHMSF